LYACCVNSRHAFLVKERALEKKRMNVQEEEENTLKGSEAGCCGCSGDGVMAF
jgi:hypothetical protein